MRRPSRRARALLAAATPLVALLGYFGGKDVVYPAAAPTHDYDNRGAMARLERSDFRSAELCKACHEEIYDQWRSSYLSKAYTSSKLEMDLHGLTLGLRGIDRQEVRFCFECHAPLGAASPDDLEARDPVTAEGVTCTVCHSVTALHLDDCPGHLSLDPNGAMAGPFDDARSPLHRTRASKLHAPEGSDLCGPCHFSRWPRSGVPIDWTFPEWRDRQSEDARGCRDCHMPEYEGKAAQLPGVPVRKLRKHTFPGGHDPAYVATAIGLAVGRSRTDSGTRLRITVTNLTGHNLPSGNAAAPEYRLLVHLDAPRGRRLLAKRTYRVQNLMPSGMETFDTTIAGSVGYDTSLEPFETRVEVVDVDHDELGLARLATLPDVEVSVEYSYRRPHDRQARTAAYIRTVINHLSFEDVGLAGLARTFTRAETYGTIRRALGTKSATPMVLHRMAVPLLRAEPIR